MINSIKKKIIYQVYLSFILLTGFIMFAVGYVSLKEQKNSIMEVMRTQALTISKSIELVTADAMVQDDSSFLVEFGLKVLNQNKAINFLIISKENAPSLIVAKDFWRVEENLPNDIKILQSKESSGEIMKNELGIEDLDEYYHFSYPLDFDGLLWGWIHLGFSLDNLNNSIDAVYSKMLYIFIFIFSTLSVIIYFLSRYIAKPIIELNTATQKITKGDLHVNLTTSRVDEIGSLTENFNIMAESLLNAQKKLMETNSQLEEKVKARTKELQEINKTLDSRVHEEISKRRDQEQMMVQQSRFAAMGEMIGNIAHQWRQPLNALSLLLQNTAVDFMIGRLNQESINRLNDKGNTLIKTMSETIDDFRNFFKPNKDKELFNISEQINKTLDMVTASFENNQITITTDMDNELNVVGYANEFSQVVLNILNNARDALLEKDISQKNIKICTEEDEEYVTVSICDNAGGIAVEIIDKIFDPYFTTKEEGKGTGIGLYMSKMIIETNMNGKLSIKNNENGALFTIALKKEKESEQ